MGNSGITESSGSEKRKLLKKIKGYYRYGHQIKVVNQIAGSGIAGATGAGRTQVTKTH